MRVFGSKAAQEPKTMTELREVGMINLALTKEHGLDYEEILGTTNKFGVKNKKKTFVSFEDNINKQFDLQPSEPATRESKRAGLMGYKIGCTHFWDKWGKLIPCTVIQVDRCQVIQVKTEAHDGVNAVQVGVGEKLPHRQLKPTIGHLLKYNLPSKRHFGEFPCSPENLLPIGYCLGPRHFKIGQFVDV